LTLSSATWIESTPSILFLIFILILSSIYA
jgi:hypothetical protein